MSNGPEKCLSCGGTEFTNPKDINGYVPATFGWFGDPLVGFACSDCGYVHLYRRPRKKASAKPFKERTRENKGDDGDDAGDDES
ncbi:MAG: hypothetical protein ACYTDX_04880 [Planctomycetota bacterium]|jgi:rubredoxin